MKKLKVAVVGVGHLGKIHARIYSELPEVQLVAVVDSDKERADEIASQFNAKAYYDYHDVLDKVDVASIVVPTSSHFEVARAFIENKVPLLIEKPMTLSSTEGKKLVEMAEKAGVIVQVGHVERFNPAITAVLNYIDSPRFIEAHRLSPFSFRSTDIDVVMDMMIHDLDIVIAFNNSAPNRIDAVGVNIISDKLDIANVRLHFPNGCVANLTASRSSDKALRKMRIFTNSSYTSINFMSKEAIIYSKSEKLKEGSFSKLLAEASPSITPLDFTVGELLSISKLQVPDAEPLKNEIVSFIDCVRNRKEPIVSGRHALLAIETAESIIKAINDKL